MHFVKEKPWLMKINHQCQNLLQEAPNEENWLSHFKGESKKILKNC